jgi:hypothetical protein
MSDRFRADPFEPPQTHDPRSHAPQSHAPQSRGTQACSPEDELDWKGVLERVREEFRSGRAPDGVQRTFR